jgi:hypothetical protein
MKLQAMAATLFAATALVGGTAVAQATMEPIPNPPENGMSSHSMHHHMMKKHHMMKRHHMMKKDKMPDTSEDMSPPAAAPH